ncbi:MAG: hypothetical protein ACO2OS_07510 [Thermosphaera aggregans]|uniref:hypothetical protein n=1 Tax=Thermosphaera aggregans TaxID=54254 RepID=UPI003C0E357B
MKKDLDEFGGIKDLRIEGEGFFRVKEYMGRLYLVDPDGNAFIIKGVNYVWFNADLSITYEAPYTRNIQTRYGSRDEWAKESKKRLIEWGFNASGAWSDPDVGPIYAESTCNA